MHEGDELKKILKTKPNSIGKTAELLNMSRQNLNYHLRKDRLDPVFERLIKDKMGLVNNGQGFTIAKESIKNNFEAELLKRLNELEQQQKADRLEIAKLKDLIDKQ